MSDDTKLAILVGGGPAPGINSVIGAATIRSRLEGVEVLGIPDGFADLIAGDISRVSPLDIDDVSRIHFRGGSILGTSRANPTRSERDLDACVRTLCELGVSHLITIGGDDTALSAAHVARRGGDKLRVVHVPKTIDNDLDLPPDIDTFGYQTARHVGADIVKNIMTDAFTTSRWYFVVAMGRKAGHLALGIGKAAGATLTLVPEEFSGGRVPLAMVVDTLAGAIIKRASYGRRHGVAVLAEGIALAVNPDDLEPYLGNLDEVERDEHGHVRIAEVDIGEVLKRAVKARLAEVGMSPTVVSKDIGYELRCADPIPYDAEYTRDLGFCAAKYLISGGHAAMVSLQGGRFVPIPFEQLIDPATKRTKVRLVDVASTRYKIAHRYMIRLRSEDFTDSQELQRLAATTSLSPEEFRESFAYVAADEPTPLDFSL